MASILPLDILDRRRASALKLLEESSEACEAIKKNDKAPDYETYKDAVLELADVAQCLCNCLVTIGVTSEDWEDAVLEVRKRNMERGRHELQYMRTLKVEWMLDE